MLINKIQYFAYAPNEMPNHNVNALLIAPYIDPSFSWAKSLAFAESQKVDVDYPKGIIKKIMKAKNNGSLQAIFNSTFEDSRAIMFKIGHCVCMIPSQMNPHKNIGDHSIALVVKSKNNDESNYSQTAEIASNATSLFFDRASKSKPIDSKSLFALISQELTNNPPNFGIQPE